MKKTIILSLLVLFSLSSALFAGDWISSQVTFKFSDDNIFETSRRSNSARFGDTNTRLFNENLNTYKTGDETESQLVVYKKFAGFIEGLTTETAFVFNLSVFNNETGDLLTKFKEDGSYVRIEYGNKNNKFSILAFPYNSDRFLLGWTYDLSWGGQSMWPKSKINKKTPVPGVKFDWNSKMAGAFLGFKTRPFNTNLIEEGSDGLETKDTISTTWGILAGAHIDIAESIRFDIHSGLFDKGTNPLQSQDDMDLDKENVFGTRIYAKGVSGRIAYRQNASLEVSDVMKVYRNADPRNDLNDIVNQDKPKKVQTGFGYVISMEGVFLTESLRDADARDYLTDFNGWAGDFKIKLLLKDIKINMDFIMRNPQFLLFNVPGLTAFESISNEHAELENEMLFSLGGDYEATEHLTLGFLFGYKLPASYKGEDSDSVIVIKDREDQSSFTGGLTKNKVRLPSGEKAKPILALKFSTFYELSKGTEVSGEVSYLRDENDSTVNDEGDRVLRTKSETNKLGFAIYIRSRF